MRTFPVLILLSFLSALTLNPPTARAGEPVYADLYVDFDARGRADVWLYPYSSQTPSDTGPLVQAIERSLGAPLRDVTAETDEDDDYFVRGKASRATRSLLVRREIDPEPILTALRPLGVPGIDIYISHPAAGFSSLPGGRRSKPYGEGRTEYHLPVREGKAPIHVSFGYRSVDAERLLWPFALILVLPVVLTLWVRRAALLAADADPTAAWFGYWRFLNLLSIGTWIVWFAAMGAIPSERFWEFVANTSDAYAIPVNVIPGFGLPLAVLLLCQVLSTDVFRRVRGTEWTLRDAFRQAFWGFVSTAVPLALAMTVLAALLEENARLAVVSAALAVATFLTGRIALARASDMEPHALTVGALRDRVFAMAGSAGVRLDQLYVLPTGRGRLVNAFAASGRAVLISEEMLRRFPRREIDAILAHELSHLRKKHVGGWRAVLTVFLFIAAAAAMSALSDALRGWTSLRLLAPLPILFVFMLVYFLSRRRETVADAGAVELTGDPEALIAGLVRLSHLNRLPVEWSRWHERLITHPSTLRRARAIAQTGGIAPERLEALMAGGLEESDVLDCYDIPVGYHPAETVFSTRAKQGILMRNGWTSILLMALCPTLAALVAMRAPGAIWPVYVAGAAFSVAAWLLSLDRIPEWGMPALRRRLAAKMEAEGIHAGEWGGTFVGLAPHATPRLYEHFHEWDLGFLFLTRDRFAYTGEMASFSLRREEVERITVAPGGPGWLPGLAVYIDWRCGERTGQFHLLSAGTGSRGASRRAVRDLAGRIHAWQAAEREGPETPALLARLDAPDWHEVTSASPRETARFGVVRSTVTIVALFAAGIAALAGLPFTPDRGGGGWYVVAVAANLALLGFWPAWRYREPPQATVMSSEPVPASIPEMSEEG